MAPSASAPPCGGLGFNARAEETAMRALGEEPAHFQELLDSTLGGVESRRRLAGRGGDPLWRGPCG